VKDETTRVKIRQLHAAFPESSVAVCKHVLNGSNGDLSQAYDALVYGFKPVKSKSVTTETIEDDTVVSKKRKKSQEPAIEEPGHPDSMDVDNEEENEGGQDSENSIIGFFDQNGLPPGSITSGKALSFMAEKLGNSSTNLTNSGSVKSNKKILFEVDEKLAIGLTSTPLIDRDSQSQDENVDVSSSDISSSSESSSGSSSEDESDGDDDTTSDSGDSSSDSSSGSEDDAPEETTSKKPHAASVNTQKLKDTPTQIGVAKSELRQPTAPGSGKKSTKSRNQRRRKADIINRFVNKGILPAGFTIAEFNRLDLKGGATDANVSAALEALNSQE